MVYMLHFIPHIARTNTNHEKVVGGSALSLAPPSLSAPEAHARLNHSLLSLSLCSRSALALLSLGSRSALPWALHFSPVETVVRGAPLVERDRDTIQVAESADLKADVPERLKSEIQ